mmetsp:Transcript_24518/g.44345  ORF Transcript_24518/g.44345 Transcript_24518/m.44345 type:complete len:545 (+) Transcript_24518:211-1845(+)
MPRRARARASRPSGIARVVASSIFSFFILLVIPLHSELLPLSIPSVGAFMLPSRHPVPMKRIADPSRQFSSPSSSFVRQGNRFMSKGDDASPAEDSVSTQFLLLNLLAPLLLCYISNQWSRSSLYYLVDFSAGADPAKAMNVGLSFSEGQYGLLASVAFTALFAIASLVAGSLADQSDRRKMTLLSTVAWSVATLATAAAGSYEQVLVARIAMGLSCAFTTPAAYTLLRDLVPKDRIGLANSLYGSGVYLGGGLASLSILLDNNYGWRGAMAVIGSYGLVSAGVATLVLPPDPNKATQDATTAPSDEPSSTDNSNPLSNLLNNAGTTVGTSSRVQWLFLGSFLRFCSGLCIGVWAASYYKSAFPDDASTYAVVNAFIVGVCGVTSGIGGGWLADRAAASADDENKARLLIPIMGSLLGAPAWWLTMHATSFDVAMAWLAIEYLVAECWFGPTVAVLQSSVGTKNGGTAQGLFALTGAVGNLAPSVLGFFYGQATSAGNSVDESSILSNLLGIAVCSGYLLSAACFTLSAISTTADGSEQEQKTL